MKVPTENIFLLIRSMTAAEKRYFKRHYSSEKNLTTELFDFINSQKEYDEDAVKRNFSNTKLAKNLKVYKVQLTDLLLKSLSSYHHKKNVRSKIRMGLEEIEILMDKELYALAYSKLKKIKALCIQYEEFGLIIQIITVETYLSFFYGTENTVQHPLISEIESYIQTLTNIFQLRKISFGLTYQINNELTHDPSNSDIIAYKNYLAEQLEKSKQQPLSFNQKFYLYSSLGNLYNLIDKNIEQEYQFKKQTIDLFEEHPHLVKIHARLCFAALHSYLECCFRYKKYKELEVGIQKIKSLSKEYPLLKKNLTFVYYLEAKYLHSIGDFQSILEQQEKITLQHIKKYKQESELISALLFIYFVLTFLALDNHKRVHFYLRRLHNISRRLEQSFSQFFDILELISHYETHDHDLIYNLLSSMKRKIKKNTKAAPFFKEITTFFTRLIKAQPSQKAQLAKDLQAKAKEIGNDGLLHLFKASSLLDDWLGAIIANRSYAAQIAQKHQN